MKPRGDFFKINEIGLPPAKLIRENMKKDTNCKIRNETGAITTHSLTEKIGEYYEQLYTYKFDNSTKQFSKKHKL